MNTRSIHVRLILWYSGLVLAVSLAFGAYVDRDVHRRLYGEMERTLHRRAEQIAGNILPHLRDQPRSVVIAQLDALYTPQSRGRFIRILGPGHAIFYLSGRPAGKAFSPHDIPMPQGNVPPRVRIESLPDDRSMMVVTVPARVEGTDYTVEMGAPTARMDQALDSLITALLIGLPAMVLIVSAGGYVLVRRALQPVENIRATAERITFGNLSNRLPVATTGDALEHLSVTLNQMLERLENAYEQTRRFSADASHELRTPLTIMRGELESVLREPLPGGLYESIGSVLEEVERLSHIAESLFAMSRLDAGEARVHHQRVDLEALTRATADQMALLAEEKRIALTIDGDGAVPVTGDVTRLKQVVVNLLDNAIKYTQEGGRIRLRVSVAQDKALLEVRDNGIGISAADLPHVFERFYRADRVRSREQGGAGLGLSIARSICQAHGGSVDIESNEGEGTACRVELPLASMEERKGIAYAQA